VSLFWQIKEILLSFHLYKIYDVNFYKKIYQENSRGRGPCSESLEMICTLLLLSLLSCELTLFFYIFRVTIISIEATKKFAVENFNSPPGSNQFCVDET
jgi:hypothetical protein